MTAFTSSNSSGLGNVVGLEARRGGTSTTSKHWTRALAAWQLQLSRGRDVARRGALNLKLSTGLGRSFVSDGLMADGRPIDDSGNMDRPTGWLDD